MEETIAKDLLQEDTGARREGRRDASGWPGISPRWTSSAKSGVGTALSADSPVWFTLSHGILNEVYYPRPDLAEIRDLGLIVTDGADFFSEEKRDAEHQVEYAAPGVPAFKLTNRCREGRYRVVKEIISDPKRSVVLQRISFEALEGELADYHLYALLAPHLGDQGANNTAWVGDRRGATILFAQREDTALALVCSAPWRKAAAGFVGRSDGWLDLKAHKELRSDATRAENGNVALTGEVDLRACAGEFVLALGFAPSPSEAAAVAMSSLAEGFDRAHETYVNAWHTWGSKLRSFGKKKGAAVGHDLTALSAAVLRVQESKVRSGAIIASLSIPWGDAHGDADGGGYHLVWPRDLVEAAGGLLAVGANEDARSILHYLKTVQHADGHWPQNMWLDGSPYWQGRQLDETALPILLVDLAKRNGALNDEELTGLWPMVRRAASYVVRHGPVTQQDRWEENSGYTPFTLAASIAALLVAAELAEQQDEPEPAAYLRETADAWNGELERWIYVRDTELAGRVGVGGYYVRIGPPSGSGTDLSGTVNLKNQPPEASSITANELVSVDALALVRFGLRDANDPRILDTLKVIDDVLKVDTPNGAGWHRYTRDGYGEHEDGSPYDGTGIGRLWPVLTGERAHYELAAGNREEARELLKTMRRFAGPGGLIPEQVWDDADMPEHDLHTGQPSGSAMPLVWAHAEYVKLRRSLEDGQIFDRPPQTVQRYLEDGTRSAHVPWRFERQALSLPQGKTLRIETAAASRVHWSSDDWKTVHDTSSRSTGLGGHVADLSTGDLSVGSRVLFTFYWLDAERWEGQNFSVTVVADPTEADAPKKVTKTEGSKGRQRKSAKQHPKERTTEHRAKP